MKMIDDVIEFRRLVDRGAVVAYPTEAVYGLGCDPFNEETVNKLLILKGREAVKGLIVLIASWDQLNALITPVSESRMKAVKQTWPGPVTWIFPRSKNVPNWVTGGRETIAIRMSAHPIAHAISRDGPVISTSANISGEQPAKTLEELNRQFPQAEMRCLSGALGRAEQPSQIVDVMTGQRLR